MGAHSRGLVRLAPEALPGVRTGPRARPPSPHLALVWRPGGCDGEREAAETGSWMSLPAVSRRGQDQKAGENGIRRVAGRRRSPRESDASHIADPPAIYSLPEAQRAAAARTRPARPDDVTARPAGQSRPAEAWRSRRAPRRQHAAGQSRPRRGPVGPPTPRSSASLLEQPGRFSEPLSHGEAAPRRRTRPAAGRGKAESRRRRRGRVERRPHGNPRWEKARARSAEGPPRGTEPAWARRAPGVGERA